MNIGIFIDPIISYAFNRFCILKSENSNNFVEITVNFYFLIPFFASKSTTSTLPIYPAPMVTGHIFENFNYSAHFMHNVHALVLTFESCCSPISNQFLALVHNYRYILHLGKYFLNGDLLLLC